MARTPRHSGQSMNCSQFFYDLSFTYLEAYDYIVANRKRFTLESRPADGADGVESWHLVVDWETAFWELGRLNATVVDEGSEEGKGKVNVAVGSSEVGDNVDGLMGGKAEGKHVVKKSSRKEKTAVKEILAGGNGKDKGLRGKHNAGNFSKVVAERKNRKAGGTATDGDTTESDPEFNVSKMNKATKGVYKRN